MTQPAISLRPTDTSGLTKDQQKYELLKWFLGKSGLFWNRLPITPELILAWFEEIQPYTAKAIETAMKKYFKAEEFFPVPGTLIPYIKDCVNYLEPKE